MISEVVQGKVKDSSTGQPNNVKNSPVETPQELVEIGTSDSKVNDQSTESRCKCACSDVNVTNVSNIVTELLKRSQKGSKTVIKLEIEIHNE